jgi:hypothetical protein
VEMLLNERRKEKFQKTKKNSIVFVNAKEKL